MQKAMKNMLLYLLFLKHAFALGFGAKNPWDCFIKILTDPVYTEILLRLDEKECEANVIDLNTLFRGVDNTKKKSDEFDTLDSNKIGLAAYLEKIKQHSYSIKAITENMQESDLTEEYKIPEDEANNSILSSISLKYDFRQQFLPKHDPSIKREHSYLFTGLETSDNEDKHNVGHKDVDLKNNEKKSEKEEKTTFIDYGYDTADEKAKAFAKTQIYVVDEEKSEPELLEETIKKIKNGTLEPNKEENTKDSNKIHKKKDLEDVEDNSGDISDNESDKASIRDSNQQNSNNGAKQTAEPGKEQAKNGVKETDEQTYSERKDQKNNDDNKLQISVQKLDANDNDNKENLDQETASKTQKDSVGYNYDLFYEIKDYNDNVNINDFPVRPSYPLFESESDKYPGNKSRITMFAIQNRILESSTSSMKEIVIKALKTFELLPKCIKTALLQCNPDRTKVVKKCEQFHEKLLAKKSNDHKVSCIEENLTVKLQCNNNEDLINNTCYTKCPAGFKDAKLFCMKSYYIKRRVIPYKGQKINDEIEFKWGDSFIVQKCKVFGQYYEDAGIDFCRPICPDTFINHGILCEKPARFKNQPIFIFDESYVDNGHN